LPGPRSIHFDPEKRKTNEEKKRGEMKNQE
jgi:hypothetical protein